MLFRSGQLELRDVEATPDAGTYTGKLVNGHIEGTFTRADGGRMFPMILDAER